MRFRAYRLNLKPQLSQSLKKEELYDRLLSSLGVDFELDSAIAYAGWKGNAPLWQKEVICETLILENRLRERGELVGKPLLSKILNEVWIYFENLPLEKTKDAGRGQVLEMFSEAVSCMEISETTKGAILQALTKPFSPRENLLREVVGLGPLKGEKNGNGEV